MFRSSFSKFHQISIIILIFTINSPAITGGHPRVYVNSNIVSEIKTALKDQNSLQYQMYQNVKNMDHPLVDAFKFLVSNDTAGGLKAVNDCLTALKQCNDARLVTTPFQYGACVYDWCYSLLSESQKQNYITQFTRIANIDPPYYPAKSSGNFVASHKDEGWLLSGQIPIGIAIYDENRVMLDSAMKVFENKYVPISNFYYKSHMHHQGDSYTGTRFYHELLAEQAVKIAFNKSYYSEEQGSVPYQMVYNSRPDRLQLRRGDSYNFMGNTSKGDLLITAGFMYNDQALVSFGFDKYFKSLSPIQEIIGIIVSVESSVKSVGNQVSDLPKAKYFPSPQGEIIWRTDWVMENNKSNSPVIQMRIGEYFFGNHQTRDLGTFQIYYKGALAINSGFYGTYDDDHEHNYAHESISTNGLLIYDPQEQKLSSNSSRLISGGEDLNLSPNDINDLTSHRVGKVTSRYIYDNSELSYISGDITGAYTNKVSKVTRSMVSIKTNDTKHPAAFFIFDRVTSAKPEYKKTWLMHTLQEPTISDNRMVVVNTRPYYNISGNFDSQKGSYSGKLISDCLLPEKSQITKIGGPGKEFWVEQANRNVYPTNSSIAVYGGDTIPAAFEPGSWRIEVSPVTSQNHDYFLHAMAVMDAGTDLSEKSRLIETERMYGATLLGKAVLFSKDSLLNSNISVNFDSSKVDLLLTNLVPGEWTFNTNNTTFTKMVDDTSNSAYIKGVTGNFRASRLQGAVTPVSHPAQLMHSDSYIKNPVKIEISDYRGRKIGTFDRVNNPEDLKSFLDEKTTLGKGVYFIHLIDSHSNKVVKIIKYK